MLVAVAIENGVGKPLVALEVEEGLDGLFVNEEAFVATEARVAVEFPESDREE